MKITIIKSLRDLLNSISWTIKTGLFEVTNYMSCTLKIYRPLKVKHISNFFSTKRIENLVPGNAYILISPTATGKNHLVKTKLYSEAKKLMKRILYICGRVALANQVKYQYDDISNSGIKENYTLKGLSTVHSIDIVDVYDFQELYFNSKNREELLKHSYEYCYIIIDECHQYITDASFNPHTEEVFKFLTSVDNFPYASRIYMSATPDYVLDEIIKQETTNRSYFTKPDLLPPPSRLTNLWAHFGPEYYNCVLAGQEVTIFQFIKSYSYINPVFFTATDQIERALGHIRLKGRTLIFTPTKKYGLELKGKLENAEYIDAESKNSEQAKSFEKLISEHTFETDYLIVTKFLDVGVDLIDITLQNVIIFSPYQHEIIQMLGRKRAKEGETLNVYIYVPPYEDLLKSYNELNRELHEMQRNRSFYQSCADFNIDEIPNHFWIKRENTMTNLKFNNFAVINNEKRIDELNEYITGFSGSSTDYYKHYRDRILDLLPGHHEPNWLDDESNALADIMEKIQSYIGRELSHDEAHSFCHIVLNHFGRKLRKNQQNRINTNTVNKLMENNGIILKLKSTGKQTWEVK